jgi:hypothetical protein
MLRNGVSKEETEGLINNWPKTVTQHDANIPAEYALPRLCEMEGLMNNFMKNLNKNRMAIHIRQIPPDILAKSDKDIHRNWLTMTKIT